MVMTVDIPDIVVQEAWSRGMAVEQLLREKFADLPERVETTLQAGEAIPPGSAPFRSGMKTPAEAAVSMREMAKLYTLGGEVTIKQLIEEGRRY